MLKRRIRKEKEKMKEGRKKNQKRENHSTNRNNISKMKTILLNRKDEETQIFIKKREEQGKKQVVRNPRVSFEVNYNRKSGRGNRKELNRTRVGKLKNQVGYESDNYLVSDLKRRREKELKKRTTTVITIRNTTFEEKKEKRTEVTEWKEQVARVGTGYRVRKDDKDPRKRRFDVGYADRKTYKRKEGRDARIDSSNIGRTLTCKGKDARVKVINAVCDIEKRRPVSEYTGSGILRKSMVGKLKFKPTKASGKE